MDWEAQAEAVAERLRQWMADNGREPGGLHIVDARDYPELRGLMADYGPNWEGSDGLRWMVRRVDQLVNVYIKS